MRPPRPRLTIGRLMALVLLVALDLGIIRAIMPPRGLSPRLGDLIVCCVLPMANVLAVGLVILRTSEWGDPAIRSGVLGFEVAGAAVMGLCLIGALVATDPMHRLLDDLLGFFWLPPGPHKGITAIFLSLIPQVAAGLVGAGIGRARA